MELKKPTILLERLGLFEFLDNQKFVSRIIEKKLHYAETVENFSTGYTDETFSSNHGVGS